MGDYSFKSFIHINSDFVSYSIGSASPTTPSYGFIAFSCVPSWWFQTVPASEEFIK